ncbi:MFS transporter [Burkholderia dolosa]|uniref:MFS transporter n=1 Tax=Burkholderia dolosa TaxID=152500 RepID=A0A892IHP3_9BURK|nr:MULTISPECIES: MFS transporter [Burkholderia]AKE05647.1 MFS transporter [Burkholderia cepacia]AJY09697.1 major Facilitator Superfamily protein [Burkholderia dolosa AU0158]AYZ94024.1 MFS transporter [Burkholderia dolosa]ETP62232.1 MFS transporter [Burkholderia dolosa PC543]MBR8419070.1 MFS transporter [Burkholderia dolosa]
MRPDHSAAVDAASAAAVSTSARAWLSVLTVAISAFAFVTTEFLPVGVLPRVAADFGVTAGAAGLMVTIPGIVALFAAPGIVLAAGRLNRRRVVLLLTACLLASNVIAALAPDLSTMLIGRALLGAALGGFWTLAIAAATRLVQPADVPKAMATILGGVTCATVIGVPIGTYIAGIASWRAAFASTAVLVGIALAAQFRLVPSLPSHTAIRGQDLVGPLRERQVRLVLLVAGLLFGAHFCAYTYIAPFVVAHTNFTMSSVTWLLLGFGIVGFLSNLAFSKAVERDVTRSIVVAAVMLLAAQAALPVVAPVKAGVAAVLMLWGIAFGGIPLCCSVWMQRTTPDNAEAGSALFVCVLQLAIAIGSSVGGFVVDHVGSADVFGVGAILALVTLLMFELKKPGTARTMPLRVSNDVRARECPTAMAPRVPAGENE